MQIVRGPNNRFKSAVEPYFLDKMSEANREQMDKLLGTIWGELLADISQSRNVSVEQLNHIADNLETYFDADKGIGYNLVRVSIQSNDFSSAQFSYVEPGDTELKTFQID